MQQRTKLRGGFMNKDRVEGTAKDIAGRVERQVGEWTGDTDKQVQGTAKQVEGKVQNALGKVKDAVKKNSGSTTDAYEQGREDEAVDEAVGQNRRSRA